MLAFVLPPPERDAAELKRLFGYQRVTLAPGESALVEFDVGGEPEARGEGGAFEVLLTDGVDLELRRKVVVVAPARDSAL